MTPQLIACDIDGTLVTGKKRTVDARVFACIDALQQRGVRFCAASGRQYTSLRAVFAPVADEIYYLCENGAIVYGTGSQDAAQVLSKTAMPRAEAERIANEIVSLDGCEVLISGANMSYVMPKEVDMVSRMHNFTGNNVTAVRSTGDIGEDIIKVSAFGPDANAMYAQMHTQWEQQFSVAVAGAQWVDFTLADKGTGLRGLCAALGIAPEHVMAFGDNFNDVPMLDFVGAPYIMAGAVSELLQRYPNHCADVADVLETLL